MMWETRHQNLLERFAAMYPPPMADEACREWTWKLAQQFAYAFPGEGWGTKRADAGRPPSTDCICTRSPFVGYDVIITQGQPEQYLARFPEGLNLAGQIFMAVGAANHLGGAPPVQLPPPVKLPAYPDERTFWNAFTLFVTKAYNDAGRSFPDPADPHAYMRFSRCGFDIGAGMDKDEAANKHIGELRGDLGL